MFSCRSQPISASAFALALLLASTVTGVAHASVVIAGTRVIYLGHAREKTVQLTNHDRFPNVVQAWVDVDDTASTPASADAPFLLSPPVFRMAPGASQTLRVVYTGQGLPQDRESLFHLNVQQIPPRNSAHAGKNQMLVMLRNRLKLFYRPAGIADRPEQLSEQLRFSLDQEEAKGWRVRVENPSGYYASFGGATLRVGERQWTLQTRMIPPHGHADWAPATPGALPAGTVQLHALMINDYGARLDIRRELSR